MNQLNKIIETTKETVKKSSSYRPISSLEEDFEKYEKRGFIEAISTKVSKEETAIIAEIKKDLQIDSPSQSLELIKTTLQNKGFKSGEDITSLNSAAVIYVSDLVTSFEKAFEISIDVLKSGSGFDKLKELATFSNNFNESA